jgi:hypothetical protein
MAMANYRVEQSDGSATFYQFEDGDPGLEALQAAAKSKTSEVKSVKKEDPPKTSSEQLQGGD